MKKLFSVFLTLILILSLATTAFAETDTENPPEGSVKLELTGLTDHTYAVYQIFTGDVDEEKAAAGGTEKLVLSNVKYGVNFVPEGSAAGDFVPLETLNDIAALTNPTEYFKMLIHEGNTPFWEINKDGTNVSDASKMVLPGYYMIVDTTAADALPDGQTKSPIILKVLGPLTVASKHATVSSEKKVADANDSYAVDPNAPIDWQDTADYDIGDAVPFQLSFTLPETFNSYTDYTITFHDKQAEGFGEPVIQDVYILTAGGSKIDVPEAYYTLNYHEGETCISAKCEFQPCSFTVEVGDLKQVYASTPFTNGDKVIVEYTSTLAYNGKVNIGRTGNENDMYVCHPDGHTLMDSVIVFTYELKINKVDGDTEEALPGAAFTLYKLNAAGEWVEVPAPSVENGNIFTWMGIDDGKYKLVESKTPTDYNTMVPMEFEVVAQHQASWEKGDNSAFLDLTAKNEKGETVIRDENDEGVEDGKLETDIDNFKGAVLPETGGTGTVMLITGSFMLVLVAAVFMIVRKKMSVYED